MVARGRFWLPPLQPALLELARSGCWRAPGPDSPERQFSCRVYFTAELSLPAFDTCCTLIRVPPLRVRRQDLGEWLRYGVRQRARRLGWDRLPQVSDGVVKRLQNYDFPNNLRELDDHIYRALQQARQQNKGAFSAAGTGPYRLPDDVFWTPSRSTRVRVDIWRWKPALREWMRSPWLWNGLLFGLVSWVFVLVNLWLWLGPQDRHHNGALSLFWAWW